MPFPKKRKWFRETMQELKKYAREREQLKPEEHVTIVVSRENLLADSIELVMNKLPAQMRTTFRITFRGEEAVTADSSGEEAAREWFLLTSQALFNADFGMFKCSSTYLQINPDSGLADEGHEQIFTFAGRLLGKALLEGKPVHANLALPLYKHMLGAPMTIEDLQYIDNDVYQLMITTMEMEPEQIEGLCINFTYTRTCFGEASTYELKPGGADIEVTGENLREYFALQLKRLLLGEVEVQLTCFMQGLYSVVPQHVLSMLEFQELEMLLCTGHDHI
jgi:E3 ubiquitin-protein ligase NEDD4